MGIGCEITQRFGLTAMRMNGVVSIYERMSKVPVKQYIDNETPLEVLIFKLVNSSPDFIGNVK